MHGLDVGPEVYSLPKRKVVPEAQVETHHPLVAIVKLRRELGGDQVGGLQQHQLVEGDSQDDPGLVVPQVGVGGGRHQQHGVHRQTHHQEDGEHGPEEAILVSHPQQRAHILRHEAQQPPTLKPWWCTRSEKGGDVMVTVVEQDRRAQHDAGGERADADGEEVEHGEEEPEDGEGEQRCIHLHTVVEGHLVHQGHGQLDAGGADVQGHQDYAVLEGDQHVQHRTTHNLRGVAMLAAASSLATITVKTVLEHLSHGIVVELEVEHLVEETHVEGHTRHDETVHGRVVIEAVEVEQQDLLALPGHIDGHHEGEAVGHARQHQQSLDGANAAHSLPITPSDRLDGGEVVMEVIHPRHRVPVSPEAWPTQRQHVRPSPCFDH